MNSKHQHLEMIQGVINRLAQSSFLLKGWSVILVSALFALAASAAQPLFLCVALFPGIVFWVLDGYFLWQERLYRALYDHVRTLDERAIDFSMDTSLMRDSTHGWRDAIFSRTLVMFHGTLVGAILIITLLAMFTKYGGHSNGT